MIKNLKELQENSKNSHFAKQFSIALHKKNIASSPVVITEEFNKYSKDIRLKPHTVRKWLLGISQPRTEILLLLADWLTLDPNRC